jgi:Lipopolysaccharide-assembly
MTTMTSTLRGVALAGTLLASSCLYSFRAGSFPPPYIKTIAVEPFDNETPRFELTGELHEQLLKSLPRALGIRTAGADVADAIVKGTILRYDVAAPNYRAGATGQPAEVLQRQVTITVKVQIIDQVKNVVLWEDTGVTALGQFADASETEDVGRTQAIQTLVQKIVDGAQSNW